MFLSGDSGNLTRRRRPSSSSLIENSFEISVMALVDDNYGEEARGHKFPLPREVVANGPIRKAHQHCVFTEVLSVRCQQLKSRPQRTRKHLFEQVMGVHVKFLHNYFML